MVRPCVVTWTRDGSKGGKPSASIAKSCLVFVRFELVQKYFGTIRNMHEFSTWYLHYDHVSLKNKAHTPKTPQKSIWYFTAVITAGKSFIPSTQQVRSAKLVHSKYRKSTMASPTSSTVTVFAGVQVAIAAPKLPLHFGVVTCEFKSQSLK